MLKRWLSACLAVALVGGLATADENIFIRGKEKPTRGKITEESPKGVQVGVKDSISAADIVDIVYELTPVSANIAYGAAVKAEKDSLEPAADAKRKALIEDATKKYE